MKNPYLRIVIFSAFFISATLLNQGCKKSDSTATTTTAPAITTTSVVLNVTATAATTGGVVTSTGGADITANGVCYSAVNKTPSLTDSFTTDVINAAGTQNNTFISNLTKLTPNTLYYVRAYATNSAGTSYGSVVTFTTGSNSSSVTSVITTFAGNGTAGSTNGTGTAATFNNPQGVAVDAQGNVYVSDSYNNLIRKITPAGVVTTVAGTGIAGYTDGAASVAQFYAPQGLAVDASGNIFVADLGNNVIRKITPAGIVSTFAGTGFAGYVDGAGIGTAQFRAPRAIAFDASGNLFVADRNNNIVREITSAGVVSTYAGITTPGFIDGTGTAMEFNKPTGLSIDGSGNIYVADIGNYAIRKIATGAVVTTLLGNPSQPTLINLPVATAVDAKGNLLILDEGGRIFEYTAAGILYTIAGSANTAGFVNGSSSTALFNNPQSIAVDANGNIYVADQYNNCIRKINVTIVQ